MFCPIFFFPLQKLISVKPIVTIAESWSTIAVLEIENIQGIYFKTQATKPVNSVAH